MQPEWRTCPRWDTRCPGTAWLPRAMRRSVAPHPRLSRRDQRGRKNRREPRAQRNRRHPGVQSGRSDLSGRRIVAGQSAGIPFGGYARLVGAPNYAPSLRSVAGLLLALALESRLREPPPPFLLVHRGASHHCRAFGRVRVRSSSSCARVSGFFRPPAAPTSRPESSRPLCAGARRAQLGVPVPPWGWTRTPRTLERTRAARSAACSYRSMQGGEGVLVGAFQSEREEETRDRAERGSAVRGSDQVSVAPERTPSPTTYRDAIRSEATSSRDALSLGGATF